jgi:hypothetical protein
MRNFKGRKGYMAIKMDLEKAYDSFRLDFIRDTLMDAGFLTQLVDLVMKCIESAFLRVLWNELNPYLNLTLSRGIRQGDPLSPYIFVLCLERLSQPISKEVECGSWKPFKVSRRGPNISHFCIGDDMLLFIEAIEV